MHRVFVYGTLKKGFCRHHALSRQNFLGVATTQAEYKLLDLGDYPGLVSSDDGESIAGELYEVDEACLQNLDVIEGVAVGLYARKSIRLLSPWNDEPAIAYIYLPSTTGYPEIQQWTQ